MTIEEYIAEEFDYSRVATDTAWLVKDVVPEGHICILLAQSGAGKSFVLEWLATCVAFGHTFCDFATVEGDVLLIDQDTPTDILNKRLLRMGKTLGGKPQHRLKVFSMKDFSLANGSLIYAIKKANVRLTIIDSLHSICGRLNPNKTPDMSKLATLKAECLKQDHTIIIAHHLTEKNTLSLRDLMDANSHISGMGNSAIRQQADTEYILTSTIEDGHIDTIYLRPVAKRAAVSQRPIMMRIIEPNTESMSLEFAGWYEPDMDEAEQDVFLLVSERQQEYTVKEIMEAVGQKYTIREIRDALVSLETKRKIVMSRSKHNMFKYRMPKSE